MITIYTDGSCIGNPGPGGWAAIIINEKKQHHISGRKKKHHKQSNGITSSHQSARAI